MTAADTAHALCVAHGGLRKAAKATGIGKDMLSRIRAGATEPSEELEKFMERKLKEVMG